MSASAAEPTFEDFVAARSTALLRTATLLTGDRAHGEDLLQTSLAKAWFAWNQITGSHEAYVRRIIVNTYASWWRRKWTGEVPTEALPEMAVGDPADSSASWHDLCAALGRLPRRQRAVVVLRFFDDLSEAQTAAAMDCSVGTVKSQTSKALAKLRLDPALVKRGTESA